MAAAQFLLLSVPEGLKTGGTVRVTGAAATEGGAQQELENLDSSILGRVAVVEVKQVYERRPAVQNLPIDTSLIDTDR
jgi:hypothetical protein